MRPKTFIQFGVAVVLSLRIGIAQQAAPAAAPAAPAAGRGRGFVPRPPDPPRATARRTLAAFRPALIDVESPNRDRHIAGLR
jgi:hypothetical protein